MNLLTPEGLGSLAILILTVLNSLGIIRLQKRTDPNPTKTVKMTAEEYAQYKNVIKQINQSERKES